MNGVVLSVINGFGFGIGLACAVALLRTLFHFGFC